MLGPEDRLSILNGAHIEMKCGSREVRMFCIARTINVDEFMWFYNRMMEQKHPDKKLAHVVIMPTASDRSHFAVHAIAKYDDSLDPEYLYWFPTRIYRFADEDTEDGYVDGQIRGAIKNHYRISALPMASETYAGFDSFAGLMEFFSCEELCFDNRVPDVIIKNMREED